MKKHPEYILYTGLGLWLALNLIQAVFSELHDDEAYYFVWAQHLD